MAGEEESKINIFKNMTTTRVKDEIFFYFTFKNYNKFMKIEVHSTATANVSNSTSILTHKFTLICRMVVKKFDRA